MSYPFAPVAAGPPHRIARRATAVFPGLLPQVALALLSAALLSSAGRPWGSGYLAWLALVPLLVATYGEQRVLRGALAFGLASLGLTVIAFEGVVLVVPWAFPLLLLSQSLWFAAAGGALVLVRNTFGERFALVAVPLAWLAAEHLPAQRAIWGDLANPLTRIGYTQFDTVLLPAAQWSGASGVGLLVLLLNLGLFVALGRRRIAAGMVAVALPAVVLFLPTPAAAEDGSAGPLEVAIVQGSVGRFDVLLGRFDRDAASAVLEPYRRLTERAAERGADLVIWPETILPIPIEGGRVEPFMATALAAADTVLTGAVVRSGNMTANSALLWQAGEPTEVYRKRALVPVIESHYTPGRAVPTPTVNETRLGIGICLDSAFPGIVRDSVLRGAQALIFLTDDGFAGETVTPELHLRISAFRAAEIGKPVVFVAQSGPSAFISETGRVVSRLEHGTAAAQLGKVVGNDRLTPFVRLGDWLGSLAVLLSLFAVAYCLILQIGKRDRKTAETGQGTALAEPKHPHSHQC